MLCHGAMQCGLVQVIGQLLELQFTNVIQRVLAMRVRPKIDLRRTRITNFHSLLVYNNSIPLKQ